MGCWMMLVFNVWEKGHTQGAHTPEQKGAATHYQVLDSSSLQPNVDLTRNSDKL